MLSRDLSDVTERVRQRARNLGFDAVRITDAAPPASADQFREALATGRHADLHWLARNAEKRVNPDLVLPGVRSVVVVAASYHRKNQHKPVSTNAGQIIPSKARLTGIVARYARYDDYHDILADRLRLLAADLDQWSDPGTRSLWYVDTGPILERDLAQRAGLGFIGKHTNLISRELGNWFLLGEVLTTVPLIPDPPESNHCGSCTRCLTVCPTGALPKPFVLETQRCISYLTIELKGSIPEPLRPLIGDRIFGCDDCLAACPWNRFAQEGALMQSRVRSALDQPDLLALLELDDLGFKAQFRGTPLIRTKRRGLLRNVCVALGNMGDPVALPALHRARRDPEPMIAEHADWAVRRIERGDKKAGHGDVPG